MDGKRFDLVLKSLSTSTSRRRTLGGLLAGAVAGLANPEAGEAKRACKKKCGKCERCRKGKCRRKPNGARCGTNKFCQAGICRLRCGDGVPCFVFVSSSTHSGNLGGLVGADRICQRLADRASLPGLYSAWLSDTTGGNSPNTRFRTSNGPYVLVDGTPVASSYADLTSGSIDAPIRLMETRSFDGGSFVWTNTQPNGAPGGSFAFASCGDWTSEDASDIGNVGASNQMVAAWTASTTGTCNQPLRLYCIQQA